MQLKGLQKDLCPQEAKNEIDNHCAPAMCWSPSATFSSIIYMQCNPLNHLMREVFIPALFTKEETEDQRY